MIAQTPRRLGLRLKRAFDMVAGALFILSLAPLFLLVALLVFLSDLGSVFYLQPRAGRDGKPFLLLKFRSMRVNDLPIEALGQVTSQHALVTPTGRIIRRWKIDELPQLLNVLAGHMSLVGPRPAPIDFAARYDGWQRRRLLVRPGMTGWTQVNGGIAFTWEERILLDTWYVDHWSFRLDLRILLGTVRVVLFGDEPNYQALEQAIAYRRACERTLPEQLLAPGRARK